MTLKKISIVRQTGWMSLMVLIAGLMTGCSGSIPAPASTATSTTTVTLQGQLTDAVTGEPIVGATIDIGLRSATTDANGHYEMGNFPTNTTGGGVARDYQATITLTGVTSPINMTNAAITPRYPDRIFRMPVSAGTGIAATTHDFVVGKLSASIQGVVGDSGLLTIGGAIVELQDNTTGMVGNIIRTTTSGAVTAGYAFANVEAGMDYRLFGRTSDGAMQGNVTTGKLSDGQAMNLRLGGTPALILSGADTFSPQIIKVYPENGADVAPGSAVNVVFTFSEPIRQNAYSDPNPSTTLDNIYKDIVVSYGGMKAVSNFSHSVAWNCNQANPICDKLTITLPDPGISSKFTVDLALLSPATADATTPPDKQFLMDNAGNKLDKSPVLALGHLLSFTTNGAASAVPPVVTSPDAPGLNWDAKSVTLDWQPASGATKGYNIYRSASMVGVVEPFSLLKGAVADSRYTDTSIDLLPLKDTARSYDYRVTSINSDLIESGPSKEKVTIRDVIPPTVAGAAGTCVTPGGDSLTVVTNPATKTAYGQVQITFSEPMDVFSAETIGNYTDNTNTGAVIRAAKLTSPTTVVLDYASPSFACVNTNTNTVTIAPQVTDAAGNQLSGNLAQRSLVYKDVIPPTVVGTAGTCVPPGGISLTVATPVTSTANGQVQITFSEPMAAQAIGNYTANTGAAISAVNLTSLTTVVLDFSGPITCVNTNTVTLGTGITDVAGNALTGSLAQRTLTYLP